MVIFKIYDITEWTTNNCNTRIVHYVKKQWKADNDISQLMEYNMKNVLYYILIINKMWQRS